METLLRDRIAGEPPGTEEVSEDLLLVAGAPGPLQGFQTDHEAVTLIGTPLVVQRELRLYSGSETLRLVLALCLDGPAAARDWLIRVSSAFQREPKADAIGSLDLEPGAVGLCWAWDTEGAAGYAAFCRFNLVATLAGRLSTIRLTATGLDSQVRQLKTRPAGPAGSKPDATSIGTVPTGGRVDLPVADVQGTSLFFIASGGAVNRDPAASGRYYFRAGLARGAHRIEAFRVGAGLVPERTPMQVQIA